MFKRKIYDRMLDWKKESDGRTALLIEGPRRVGKSTIVKEFAMNEYESYILELTLLSRDHAHEFEVGVHRLQIRRKVNDIKSFRNCK